MSELFKGFEQLVELMKTLEEKMDKGEVKTDMQINSRPLSNIPRPNNMGDDIGTSRMRTQPSPNTNPGNQAASDSVVPPNTPSDHSLKDIGGLSEVLKELKELIAIPLKRPDLLAKLGLEPTRGVLLVGPPGTGKTLTARALAEELGVNYIALVGPEVISKYYGEAEQRLRGIFEKAAKNAPCIIFIDVRMRDTGRGMCSKLTIIISKKMTESSISKVKILVIDDDRIIQLILKETLQEQGYEVILASSGEQGVKQAYKYHPALIICDWLMDEMDGLEVCRRIKSEPYLSITFFILLTSKKAVEDRVEGLDTGADDFLVKPIEVSELKARVRSGLRLYQTNQELQKLAHDLQLQKQLLETELNEAADYVKSILPEPMSGLITINTRFLPCSQLGGDCFDYYWLDEDHLVIYLLDVSGHGLAAALPSISVHNLLRAHSLPTASLFQPCEVLKDLNNLFQMDKQDMRYFTIWYGVFNRSSSQLTYASAGHPPALLLSYSSGSRLEVKQLTTPELPIGVVAEATYYNAVCDIQPSSKLYVLSDGVYEVEKSNGEMWDLNSFINLLNVCNQRYKLDKLSLDHILEEIQTLTGSKIFTDDFSLIEIKFSAV